MQAACLLAASRLVILQTLHWWFNDPILIKPISMADGIQTKKACLHHMITSQYSTPTLDPGEVCYSFSFYSEGLHLFISAFWESVCHSYCASGFAPSTWWRSGSVDPSSLPSAFTVNLWSKIKIMPPYPMQWMGIQCFFSLDKTCAFVGNTGYHSVLGGNARVDLSQADIRSEQDGLILTVVPHKAPYTSPQQQCESEGPGLHSTDAPTWHADPTLGEATRELAHENTNKWNSFSKSWNLTTK